MAVKGYKFAIAWIALNDSPGDADDVDTLTSFPTVALVADLYGKEQEKVAMDVFKYRQTNNIEQTN